MAFQGPAINLNEWKRTLSEQLQEISTRLVPAETQRLLASIKQCGPTTLFKLFTELLENQPERNVTIPSLANLDETWKTFEAQFHGLKRLLTVQKLPENAPTALPPIPPQDQKPIILINGQAVAKPTFDAVQRHLAAKSASRFNLDSEIPLNTRMLLIVLRDGYLSDSGLFVCRIQQRLRDIFATFRIQCQTNEQIRFADSTSAFVNHICIVELPAVVEAPEPVSEVLPTDVVAVEMKEPPPQQENQPPEREMSLSVGGAHWKFCKHCKKLVKNRLNCKICKRALSSFIFNPAAKPVQGEVQPKGVTMKRPAKEVLEDWIKQRILKRAKLEHGITLATQNGKFAKH